MATKRQATIRQQLLKAMNESGLSEYEIAKRSGVDRGALSRFRSGKGGLTVDSLEKLAPVLGIEITTKKGGHRAR